METKTHRNPSPKPVSGGLPGIMFSVLLGRLDTSPMLKRELGYFVLLQLFALTLAILSAWLGYTRALSFCVGFKHAEQAALAVTIFIAGSAYIFVSHSMGQVGYLLQGGSFTRGQGIGLALSLALAFSIITLDLYMNFSSVKPVVEALTQERYTSHSPMIIARYDSLIVKVEQRRDEMIPQHFLYKGRVYIPDAPTRWISQEVLAEYAALQAELVQLRTTKSQELANDATQVRDDQRRYSEERTAKLDTMGLLVGLMYFLMMLASTRAGMYSGAVSTFLEKNREKAGIAEIDIPKPGVAIKANKPKKESRQIQLALMGNGKPLGGNGAQIRKRGIDQEKYLRFLRVAAEVLAERGRYVKSDIARRSGISRDTVTVYLRRGIERGDLVA